MRSSGILAGLVVVLLSSSVAAAGPWEEIFAKDGIKVWRREVPGSSFVAFRARGMIDASLRQILAVLNDQTRKTEWMHQCVANKLVHYKKLGNLVVYNRTGSNFPFVSDRDVVAESSISWSEAARRVRIDVVNIDHPRAPVVAGVVRMPKLKLSWDLVAEDVDRTEVTYQVETDPGGFLPAWVVNLATKRIPFHTINNLRRQAKEDYSQSLSVIDSGFDWAAVGMKPALSKMP